MDGDTSMEWMYSTAMTPMGSVSWGELEGFGELLMGLLGLMPGFANLGSRMKMAPAVPINGYYPGGRGVMYERFASAVSPAMAVNSTATPDATMVIPSGYSSPMNVADNYSSRMKAFFIPPKSGKYRFVIASDDSSYLQMTSKDPVTGMA